MHILSVYIKVLKFQYMFLHDFYQCFNVFKSQDQINSTRTDKYSSLQSRFAKFLSKLTKVVKNTGQINL